GYHNTSDNCTRNSNRDIVRCYHSCPPHPSSPTTIINSTLFRSRGAMAHIPSTSQRVFQRSVSRRIYRKRNLVERFFCKLKHFRRDRKSTRLNYSQVSI